MARRCWRWRAAQVVAAAVALPIVPASPEAVLAGQQGVPDRPTRSLRPWPEPKDEPLAPCAFATICSGGRCMNAQGTAPCSKTDKACTCKCEDDRFGSGCSKRKRSRIVAVLLHVFGLGIGAGSFYLEWNVIGAISFGMCCIPVCCLVCVGMCVPCCHRRAREKKRVHDGDDVPHVLTGRGWYIVPCCSLVTWFLLIVLWLMSLYWMLMEGARDGQSVPLK